MNDARSALVLFSGGQDSTTCLAWALDRFAHVETVSFDYQQRHRAELDQRLVVREQLGRRFPQWASRMADDHLVDLSVLGRISETALTRSVAFTLEGDGLPNTFVPGRNLLFFTFAATIAWRRGIRHLVGGMCETDFSGYPDCRDDTLKSLQVTLNLGMARDFVLHTPLMWLDKAATWALADSLGGDALVEIVREHTHTCYESRRDQKHAWGYGCGDCPACALRKRGFVAWKAGTTVG